jgi:hypothetical protein
MKIAGLKMKSSIKNQWCYFETIIIPDKEIKGRNFKMNIFQNNKMTLKV